MWIPEISVKRPVTISMVFLGIILLGIVSYQRLPQELFPPITFPQLTVVTYYGNAAPEEIENLITKPIEEAIGTVKNLKRIRSISKEGVSLVTAEFLWGTNMGFAHLDIREKLDRIKDMLPLEAEDPVVMRVNPFAKPVMSLSLTGVQHPYELLKIAKTIKNTLEKVDGVASVSISGGVEREIKIEINQSRLQAAKLPILSVVESLKKANINYPAGTTKGKLYEYLVRTMGEYKDIKEIKNTVVGLDIRETIQQERQPQRIEIKEPSKERRLILLSDIAKVEDTFKEKESFSRHNGKSNISISIQKQAEANIIRTTDRIKQTLENLKLGLPKDINIDIVYDESTFIKKSIKGVIVAAIQGGILAFFVLLYFLKRIKDAFIVSLAIPVSIMATFTLMFFKGISINMMSLGGLALGIGMLIDNAIVVTENISRHRLNKDLHISAISGTNEVAGAISSSTLTTIAVFLPMLFIVGIAGQLFKHLLFTVTFSLIASL